MTNQLPYKYIPPVTFSILTPLYDTFCSLFGLGKRFKQKVLDALELAAGTTVVDIGCGTGVFLQIAQQQYPQMKFIGVDPDAKALSIARHRLERAGMDVALHQAFAERLPFPDQSVDVCVSSLAFHHMPDEAKRQGIKEIYRVLKPGGSIVIADFGKSDSTFFRKVLFFEHLEYLEGNLKGYIGQYVKEAGFHSCKVIGGHFPGIKILRAKK